MPSTKQGTIWAQWIGGVVASGHHTIQVVMNHRDITAYATMREFFVIHPAQHHIGVFESGVPPSFEWGFTGISEVTSGGHHQSTDAPGWSYAHLNDVTEISFRTFNTRAVCVINYWNSEVVFAP
jgi:hypothetical protein